MKRFLPIFCVSAASVGIETALTRFFAVASWNDYGYWVISIVMAGFAFSGVLLALSRDWLVGRADFLLRWLPVALIVAAALGYLGVIVNPFNPLQLQNQVTYLPQLENIGLYYAALLPFFFLAGLFISITFVTNAGVIGRVYAADLCGAGFGAVCVLGLMYVLSVFALVPALLVLLVGARVRVSTVAVLVVAEFLLLLGPQAAVSQYKPIYPPSHTPGAVVRATVHSPQGEFVLLDDFTERVNTDISNDAAMLGYQDPPRSYGLYRDGIRIASLPMPGAVSSRYAPGALDALPYALRPNARVLLLGASGGFRVAEILQLGASSIVADEPAPVLLAALRHGLGGSPAMPADARVSVTGASPRVAGAARQFDVIDLSADFMDAAPANIYAFSAEAMAGDIRNLAPGGFLSIPVSIQDFPAYALRILATARAALAMDGVRDPAPYIMVYRSAWNARILVGAHPFVAADIAAVRKWCDDRSFDMSFYDGMDVAGARANLYNDLPAVSFDDGTVTATGDDDSIADEAAAVLAGRASVSQTAFDLRPVTDDRPGFYSILRLSQIPLLLARLQILPQAEIGALVNLAVLLQAAVLAALVLTVPVAAPRAAPAPVLRACLYFPALALGFLFIEIFGIEKATMFLDDRAAAFSIVLSAMLVCSGAGSFVSARWKGQAALAVWVTAVIVAVWAAALWFADPAALAGLPFFVKLVIVVAVMAPPSLVMGWPFALGLGEQGSKFYLAWAWGLNGAFSVVATPLANLCFRNVGLHAVLGAAVMLYAVAAITYPAAGSLKIWNRIFFVKQGSRRAASAAAEF